MILFRLKPELFEGLNKPFYEPFRDHLFKLTGLFTTGRVEIECVTDPSLGFPGLVHRDYLEVV